MLRNLGILLAVVSMATVAAENPPAARTGVAPPARIPPSAETVSPLPAGTPVSIAAVPLEVRRAVVADAAKRFGVAESAVVLTRAEQVTWNDGSLGCPEPGRMYTQNLVAGYLVIAKTTEGELSYHTDTHALVVSCGSSRPTSAKKLSEKSAVRGAAPVKDGPVTQPPAPDR
jgi:hypothetical protein